MGFSTTGAHLVIFLAFLLASSTFVGAYDASVDRALNGASRSFADRAELVETDIELNQTAYDDATNTLSFNVTNTGDRSLSVNETDVLLDNVYYGLPDLDRREVEGNASEQLWLPGENLTIEVTVSPAPNIVHVATEHGVTTTRITGDDPFVTETDPLWPSFSKNPQNNAVTTDAAPTEQPTIRWNYTVAKRVRASGVVLTRSTTDSPERRTRTTLYIGSDDQFLNALDGDDGFINWRYNLGGAVTSAVAIRNDTVVALNQNGTAVGLDQDDGSELWTTAIPGTPNLPDPPTISGDRVFIGDAGGAVTAIYMENGTIDWSIDYGAGSAGPLAAANGTLYYPDTGNDLVAIDATTGAVEWRETYSRTPSSGVAVADGIVFFGSSKEVHAIYTNGTRVWDYSASGGGKDFSNTPAVTNDTVYVANNKGTMEAIWIANGTDRWVFEPSYSTQIHTSASIAEDSVYFGDDDGFLYALWADNGTVRWSYDFSAAAVRSSPVIVEGRIYIGADDATIRAFE